MNDLETPKWDDNRYFVAEQPGWKFVFFGLLLSTLIGIFIKSFTSERVLRPYLEKAIAQADKQSKITFTSVEMSLAQGALPDFSILIKGVIIDSSDACVLKPLLEVDEIRLPLSLTALIQGRFRIKTLEANEAVISLRSETKDCRSNESTAEVGPKALTQQVQRIPSNETNRKPKFDFIGKIEEVKISHLKVHYLPVAFTSFSIEDFLVKDRSEGTRKIEIGGKLQIGGETLSGDYSSEAKLEIQIDDHNDPQWNMKIKGNWREGRYVLDADYDEKIQKLQFNFEMQHIPVSQLLPLLRKYNLASEGINPRQLWISARASSSGIVKKLGQFPMSIEQVKIEGDIGEIEIPKIFIESTQPLKIKPFHSNVNSLKILEFLHFAGKHHPGPTWGNLGVFQGKIYYDGLDRIGLQGEHSGLEFIFSNRGVRQIQSISLLSGELFFENKTWLLVINRLKPSEGLFLGTLRLKADELWKKINVHALIEDLSLSPPVQKLMTQGGFLGSISGEVDFEFTDGKMNDVRGNLIASELSLDNLEMKRPRVQIATDAEEVILDLRSAQMTMAETSLAYRVLEPVFRQLEATSPTFQLQSFSARIRTRGLKTFNWSQMYGKGDRFSVKSQGQWNEMGQLSGEIDLTNKGRKIDFKVIGHRDQPEFLLQ